MKKRLGKSAFLCFILISLLILPGFIQAQKQKIKVVTEGASIRVKPDAGSDVIASPDVGAVFEVEAKSEDWYEIKFKTDVGVSITGYIHEMYVETEKPDTQQVASRDVAAAPVRTEPAAAPEMSGPPERSIFFSLRVGGLYGSMAGYDYDFSMQYYGEPLTITESVAKGAGLGLNVEAGVIFLKYFEVTAGFSTYQKNMDGTYGFGLPNIFLWDDIAFDDAPANSSRKMTVFDFGINFHPLRTGPIRPYFGGGVSMVSAKIDFMEDMTYRETFYSDFTHSIEITEVQLTNESVSKTGFHVRGGLHVRLASKLFVFVEGKYLICKTDVPHPLTSTITGFEDEVITLDLGGVTGIVGIRLLF